jgi:heme-degrading monooxygenase HmoA
MAQEAQVVSVVTYDVTPQNMEAVVLHARQLLEDTGSTLPGFIEGALLTTEDQTQIILMAHWESRDAWARAEWNEQISRGVAALYEETASFTVRLYREVAQAKARR